MNIKVGWICALIVGWLSVQPGVAETRKPNVLFIIVDDFTTALGCYGYPDAYTPHMDAFAARGVRFENAYCQFSLCCPSRSSFLSGCYPDRTKVYDLSTNFRDALPDVMTLPDVFKRAGYKVVLTGKVFHGGEPLLEPDVMKSAPLHKDHEILEEAKALNDPADKPHGKGRGAMYNRMYAASSRPDRDFTDYEIADHAMELLDTFKGQPFFLAVGFIRPHTPYVAPQAYFDRIDPKRLTMPPFYRQGGEDLTRIPAAALRPNNNVFRFKAASLDEAREARRAYLAAAAFADAQVGRVLTKLKELKLDENTIVLLTGDNGYHLGEHGLWAKQTLFKGGTSVPLIVSAPGLRPGVCKGLVEQVDIYPTLVGLAGLPMPDTVQGLDLRPLLANPALPGKPYVFSVMQSTKGVMGRSVSNGRFTYIEWDEGRAGRQLYDYANDPDELNNLADDPERAGLIQQLRAQLTQHVRQVAKP